MQRKRKKPKYGEECIGKQFGQLTAIKPIGIINGGYGWEFKCSCGKTCYKLMASVVANVKRGINVTCGCRRKSQEFKENASLIRRRGLSLFIDKHNTSGITGVAYDRYCKRWVAYLELNGVKHRKSFKTFEEAVICRKEWEEEYGMYENI